MKKIYAGSNLLGPLGETAGGDILHGVVSTGVPLGLVVRRHPQALCGETGALGGGAGWQAQQQLRVGRHQLVRRRVPCMTDPTISLPAFPHLNHPLLRFLPWVPYSLSAIFWCEIARQRLPQNARQRAKEIRMLTGWARGSDKFAILDSRWHGNLVSCWCCLFCVGDYSIKLSAGSRTKRRVLTWLSAGWRPCE